MQKTFEAGKSIAELGIDKSQRFVVVSNTGGHDFNIGDVLVLENDDHTTDPEFRRLRDGKINYISLKDLAYEDPDVAEYPKGCEILAPGGHMGFIILEAVGTIRFLGIRHSDVEAYNSTITVSQLRQRGFKVIGAKKEEAIEVTMAEVEAKFGKKVKIKNVEKTQNYSY